MSDAETQAERPGRRRRRRRVNTAQAVALGAAQGASMNFADELFRLAGGDEGASWIEAAHEQNPIAFGAGNVLGTGLVGWGGLGRVAHLAEKGLDGARFARSAAMRDGAVGAAAGAGGMDPTKEEGLLERAGGAAVGGSIGATTAGLLPAVFARGGYAGQVIDNSPVLVNRATFGAAGSPYRLNPDRMLTRGGRYTDQILDEALGRDETAARAQGLIPAALNRNGAQFRPVDTAGPNVQSLFDMALERPAAQATYRDYVAREGAERSQGLLNRLRMNDQPLSPGAAGGRATAPNEEAQAFLQAVDDDVVHPAWVRQARKLDPATKDEVARGLVAKIQDEMATADPRTQTALAQRLAPGGDLRKKLQALGVMDETGRMMTSAQMRRSGIPMDPNAPAITRSMDAPPPRAPRFTTDADQEMATAGREAGWGYSKRGPVIGDNPPAQLDDETADQLMQLMLSPRRRVYQPPSTATDPLLAMTPLPGMRWRNPWVNGAINADSAHGAFIAGKFVAPTLEPTAMGALQGDFTQGLVPAMFHPDVYRRSAEERRQAGDPLEMLMRGF